MLPLNIVEGVNALLLEQLPLSIVVLHVLNELRHVNESIPGVHHVLNDELDETNLAFRDGTRSPAGNQGESALRN